MTGAPVPPVWVYEPFVMGTPEQFARLRELFTRLDFTEAGIGEAAGVERIYDVPSFRTRTQGLLDPADPLSLLVQLLIDGRALPWSTVQSTLAPADLASLTDLGLLRDAIDHPELCVAMVALYPDEGLFVASDRHENLGAVARGVPTDAVYSALTDETRRFVWLAPRVQCEDYLELCSGTGIAALLAAHAGAARAWAVDITERSTRFARFNAALNGLENVTALAGDLYEPVAGRTFDLITAHPPYVPSPRTEMVFRDGGEDGEGVTRRILEGLAAHLRPGGQFFCDCMMTERTGASLEQRLREMLGPEQEEFDVLVGEVRAYGVESYLAGIAGTPRSVFAPAPRDLRWHRELVERLGIERFIQTAFLIRRLRTARPAITQRRRVSGATAAADYQWFLHWAVETAGWESAAPLVECRPRWVEGTELRSRSAVGAEGWATTETVLATERPFAMQAPCPPWVPSLIARCDGRWTVAQHARHFRDLGLVPATVSDVDFAQLVGQLVGCGFLEVSEFPLPSLDAGLRA